jgi:hypothetical protein
VIGIDYSSKMIEAAKKMASYIRYYVQDTRELSFDSGLFDYALFSFNGLMLLEISSLSGGENQRIKLSQALKKGKTKIFGLDEPSMGLGRKEMIDLISVIYENIENYGKTFIVIEHNTEFLNLCQYVNELVRDNRKVKVIPGNAGLTGHKLCVNGMA